MWHVRDCIDNPIRVVREAGHIRILSGAYSDSDESYLFHKDRDRVGIKPNSPVHEGSSEEGRQHHANYATFCLVEWGLIINHLRMVI